MRTRWAIRTWVHARRPPSGGGGGEGEGSGSGGGVGWWWVGSRVFGGLDWRGRGVVEGLAVVDGGGFMVGEMEMPLRLHATGDPGRC